jgi:hypothetical protein
MDFIVISRVVTQGLFPSIWRMQAVQCFTKHLSRQAISAPWGISNSVCKSLHKLRKRRYPEISSHLRVTVIAVIGNLVSNHVVGAPIPRPQRSVRPSKRAIPLTWMIPMR